MSTTIQVKRGTTASADGITPAAGEPVFDTTLKQLRIGDGSTAGGTKVAMEGLGISRTILLNNFICPAPGTDWTPQIEGVKLAANKSAKKCWLPLNGLALGDIIVSYKVVGDVHEEAGDTVTFDCKLARINKADPLTTTDIANGGITQVTADGNFDSEANCDDETAATDKQYVLELLGTTSNVSGNEAIIVTGAEITVMRLP
jgi:hypothetical protein